MASIITLEDNVGLIYHKVAEKVLPSTTTLYIPSDKGGGSIEPLGSAVLLEYDESHFLITAGHCLRQKGEIIFSGILNGREFHNLKGMAMIEHGLNEKIDVGIFKLSKESTEVCLQNHKFISQTQILNSSGIRHPAEYLAAGWPISKFQIQHRAKKVGKDLVPLLLQSQEPRYYQKLMFSPADSLLLRFDRRRNTQWGSGEMSMAPGPKGISGCGIWYAPDYFLENLDNIALAGQVARANNAKAGFPIFQSLKKFRNQFCKD
jgi:hypothetical protein